MTWLASIGKAVAGVAGATWARLAGIGVLIGAGLAFALALIGAGRRAERAQILQRSNEVQNEMLDAAARRPRDRDAVVQRLRDGDF